jgi:hypothetical protein
MYHRLLILLFAFLTLMLPLAAQDDAFGASSPVYIFAEIDVDDTGLDRLIFVNMRTGEEAAIEVYGDQYTVLGDAVMFYDYSRFRVRLAEPDGTVYDHPFIQPGPTGERLDWVLSDDENHIAWTLTSRDALGRLQTSTYVAMVDGSNMREVLSQVDEQNRALRALPIAFSADNSRLYMDDQPDRVSEFTPFKLYAQLFAVNLQTGETTTLPGERGRCLCGADIGQGRLLRLRLTEDLQAFDLHIVDLAGGVEEALPALRLNGNYDTGGDVLLTPDGGRAVYALSRVTDFGLPSQSIRTVFVLVNLDNMSQEPLTQPIQTLVIPTDWTEDNSALILTNPLQNGTWKINLADGRLERIADATYLGRMGS